MGPTFLFKRIGNDSDFIEKFGRFYKFEIDSKLVTLIYTLVFDALRHKSGVRNSNGIVIS